MSNIRSLQQLKKSESGMVALIVTLIMMLVISLIVLGFAQVTRRTQRNALDSQLSTQAYYAAESGVNDAVNKINGFIATGSVPPKDKCTDNPSYTFTGISTLGTGVSYSCVLIDPTPSSLHYSLGLNSPVVVKLKADNNPGVRFRTLTYSWEPDPNQPGPPTACPSAASQYASVTASNCNFAVLRSELAATDSVTRASLAANTHVNFLDPVRVGAAGIIGWAAADNAKSVAASCASVCKVTIDFGPGGVANSFYLRLSALYKQTAVTISAVDNAGKVVKFQDAQAQIDVTGKAQDVLRRIRVAVKLDGTAATSPLAAITSGDSVCKRFSVTNGSFNIVDFGDSGGGGNRLCTQQDVGAATNP